MAEGLLGVRTFVIEGHVLTETIQFLQEVGAAGYEGFVLWAGTIDKADTFRFRTALIPEQQAMATGGGLLVVVDGKALFDINKQVYERGEILGGQVHTHPT